MDATAEDGSIECLIYRLDFGKMAIRPVFFKEICFTISLKNRLARRFCLNLWLKRGKPQNGFPLLR